MVELRVKAIKKSMVSFSIGNQDIKDVDFLNGASFISSFGVKMFSSVFPQVYLTKSGLILFTIRGSDKKRDDEVLTCSLTIFSKIYKTVEEYNLLQK